MISVRQGFASQRRTSQVKEEKIWRIEDFQVMEQLGKGRFGQVFVAREKTSQFVVALKRIARQEIECGNFLQQIKRQIVIQSSLNNLNILKLYGYFADSSFLYLILEHAPQGELYSYLKRKIRLPEQEISIILGQIIQGLTLLHSKLIIHRDLKPENLLLANGRIKIADFGWAVHTQRRRDTVCGTLDYLAPEIVLGETHDFKVDVWSLGILAFQLAAGRPPFEDQTHSETYKRIISAEIEFPCHISLSLRSLIRKCLNKDPQRRPQVSVLLHQPFIEPYLGCKLKIQ